MTLEGLHIEPIDRKLFKAASARLDSLTKPQGSLGRLEEFARRIVAITGSEMPLPFDRKALFIFSGDHGVTEEGVSAYPKEVTAQMVLNLLQGGAAINVLARHAGADVVVIDIGVDSKLDDHPALIRRKIVSGTRNIRKGPAMTREEALRTIETGIEVAYRYADSGYSLFGTGDMGIGNTTPSSAIASVMTGTPAAEVTGYGAGIDDDVLAHKIRVINDAIAVNRPNPSDPVGVLAAIGGAELGGIAGFILGAAKRRNPVVEDGLISTAGAIIAYGINRSSAGYMFAAHNSVEPGQGIMLETMGLEPILDLGLRLGEGTGAALAMPLIEAGVKIYRKMATFEEAGVDGKTGDG